MEETEKVLGVKFFNEFIPEAEAKKLTEYGVVSGNMHIEFTFEEMQKFLTLRGFKLIVIEGIAQVRDSESDGGGGLEWTSDFYPKKFRAIAVFSNFVKDWNKLDSQEVRDQRIDFVFKRELKKKLLGLNEPLI